MYHKEDNVKEPTYVVIDTDLISNEMVNESINQETTIRKSLDETKSILTFNVKYPNTMVGYPKYTLAEITQILIDNTSDWNVEE